MSKSQVSNCHGAEVNFLGTNDGKSNYLCSQCNQPCTLIDSPQEEEGATEYFTKTAEEIFDMVFKKRGFTQLPLNDIVSLKQFIIQAMHEFALSQQMEKKLIRTRLLALGIWICEKCLCLYPE